MTWSTRVSNDEAARRAGGRRAYNKRQRQRQQARRQQVARLLRRWGTDADAGGMMAVTLGVSVRTIERDLRALGTPPAPPLLCPTCGLPTRVDVDPAALAALDPAQLAHLERAMTGLFPAPAWPVA
jgi:hypothetical protein